MTDRKLALAGLEWFALLGAPASLIETARVELNEEDGPVAPDGGIAGPPADVADQRHPVRIELSPGTAGAFARGRRADRRDAHLFERSARLRDRRPRLDFVQFGGLGRQARPLTASGVSGAPEKAEIKASIR